MRYVPEVGQPVIKAIMINMVDSMLEAWRNQLVDLLHFPINVGLCIAAIAAYATNAPSQQQPPYARVDLHR